MTMTVDGFIARDSGTDAELVSAYAPLFFEDTTQLIGTVIVGSNTFSLLKEPFPGRLTIVMSSVPQPERNISGIVEFHSGELKDLLAELETRGLHEVAVVGGSQLNASFLVDNLIDELYVIVAPRLFGQGISLASNYDLETELRLLEERQLGSDAVLLHYEVVK